MSFFYLAIAFSLNAAANVLLKLGAQKGLVTSSAGTALVAANWQFILAFALFAANVIFYFLALRALPISIAYPTMVVMSFILINAYALTVLGERINATQLVGYGLVVLGLVLIVSFVR
ncbi:hypothetical protein A3A39_03075 [Candidatus Kaiserbacteria bacterium RIFCSPLOWO2_01_FULL_54_13]|uniref:EamA domain-containing protein n=1 Tax=Candidatus Kaiserbacteria bacterium RIFCSPLOWO2_01_FULL_54_13 TaxID=1798512 RepID=A0A1F6F2E9_9BACT|nr:MAG: hypothetical protein A3A39_03075 [Candidatus Kaiserbacteria bacterium RIFCSPLOWO2_01_FULL_54_13]